jgi:L-threonine kinase
MWPATVEIVRRRGHADDEDLRTAQHTSIPATCGELVQGTLDGMPCLVSCPIDLWSTATVSLSSNDGWQTPGAAPKARQALYSGLAHLGLRQRGGSLALSARIPRARGYGSSTADIAATLFALGQAAGHALAGDEVARLAVAVEPSDSTMFPGLAVFDHRQARFHELLGPAPALSVILIDPGGRVDTVEFNRADWTAALRSLASRHREAFDLLRLGIERADVQAIGAAATLSAQAHQGILYSPLLDQALLVAQALGAAGVCRAHSGTILGILLDPASINADQALAYAKRRLPASVAVAMYDLVGGGPRPLPAPGLAKNGAGRVL